jgi:pectate lyase
MKKHRLSRARIAALCPLLGLVALSACGSSDTDSASGPPRFGAGPTGPSAPSVPSNPVGGGSTNTPAAPMSSNPTGSASGAAGTSDTAEGNVTPVAIDGTGGTAATSGGTGAAAAPSSGGAGGAGAEPEGNAQGGSAPAQPPGEGETDGDDAEPPVANGGAPTTPPPPDAPPPPTVPANCMLPPAASPLEGWASIAGRGVTTTTGGGNANMTVVNSLAALQTAVQGTNAAVIGVLGRLEPGVLRIGSNKTIIGLCGAEIHGHVEFNASVNIIVRNITIVGFGPGNCALDPGFDASVGCSSGDDAVTVQRDSHHVWFDHCAVRDGTDGNLDVSNGADFVTISWTKFSYTPRTDNVGDDSTGAAGHRYSNLVGGTDSPSTFDDANSLNVTWHHNWWADNVVERQPRIRFGQNHLYNNYWNSETTNYCVRAGIEANILLEGNYFDGVDTPHEFNNDDDEGTANVTAGNSNTYDGTTGDRVTGGGGQAFTDPPYNYVLDNAAGVPAAITSGAGPH